LPTPNPDNWRDDYARHARALLLLARHHLPITHEAEDAVQEGFTHFWKSRHKAADPVAYLFTCVRNAARALARSRRTRDRHLAALTPPPHFEPPPADDRVPLLEAALARLPEDQREVVLLKLWGNLTFAQIAAALTIPANTAASRYGYALATLHSQLSPEASHERPA
jgi:RNA polymerase sigma-70 factor (ECF subfamily)